MLQAEPLVEGRRLPIPWLDHVLVVQVGSIWTAYAPLPRSRSSSDPLEAEAAASAGGKDVVGGRDVDAPAQGAWARRSRTGLALRRVARPSLTCQQALHPITKGDVCGSMRRHE